MTKSVMINFWPQRREENRSQPIFNGVEILVVRPTKFLGVFLQEDMNWNYHTSKLYNKLQSNKQLLSLSKNISEKGSLLKVYHAHIYSHLKYSLVIWGSMMNSESLNELYKIQKACVRLVRQKPMHL